MELDMGWIVGIRNTGAAPRLFEWNNGNLRDVGAEDASLLVDARGRYSRYTECALADFKRLDADSAAGIAELAGIPSEVARIQSFWLLTAGKRKVFVTSQTLIQALVGTYRQQRAAMFSPAGYQLMSYLVEERGELRPSFVGGRKKRTLDDIPELAAAILWSCTYPSARRMQASVLRHALDGRFDIELAQARVLLSFVGHELGADSLLATRISIAAIEPLESPEVHAAGKVPGRFVIREVEEISPERRKSSWVKAAPRGPQDLGYDADIRDDRFSTPLTDEEWQAVRGMLFKHPRRLQLHEASARSKVDLILLKRSTGATWRSVTASTKEKMVVEGYFSRLMAAGTWEPVRAHLVKARGGPANARKTRAARSGVAPLAPAADQIRALRIQRLNMTTKELASVLRVSAASVMGWESGQRVPTPKVAAMLRVLDAKGVDGLDEVRAMPAGGRHDRDDAAR
ncbi:hypothetical protein ACS5PN_11670 [Roseateles sp. NT4]|uniref:hypothetical protein n=1 Tax=Roseateles sp. NT4 TaxID=3453715 RepID=UPI003EE85A30